MDRKLIKQRLKAIAVAFAIYLASFGVVLWATSNRNLEGPALTVVWVLYAPLIYFYNWVGSLLK